MIGSLAFPFNLLNNSQRKDYDTVISVDNPKGEKDLSFSDSPKDSKKEKMKKWVNNIGLVGGFSAVSVITVFIARLLSGKTACFLEPSKFILFLEIALSFLCWIILLLMLLDNLKEKVK